VATKLVPGLDVLYDVMQGIGEDARERVKEWLARNELANVDLSLHVKRPTSIWEFLAP